MTDQYGRVIDYMRVSITDRCNLRCRYCMPEGVVLAEHGDLLTYEEILRVCRAAVSLGIVKFKITGGEPLVRRGCTDFIARLKALPGVEQVTLTTNGLLLSKHLAALCQAGIDGINISLDTMDGAVYRELTGSDADASTVVQAVRECTARGLRVKTNTVLLERTLPGVVELAALARELPVDVRFIELMPIGEGAALKGVPMDAALGLLRERWPDLHPVEERRGNGPARYYACRNLMGRIGFIDAVSHRFCGRCNRVRLTSTGMLKPCLCYEEGTDFRALLRADRDDAALRNAIQACVWRKPQAHCFARSREITERGAMNQIGG